MPHTSLNTPAASAAGKARLAALVFVVLWFAVGGVAHFAFTEAEMRIVPPWMPWPREVVWITGILEVLGAAGLLWPRMRRAAGVGLFLLTVAVTPANVHMLLHAQDFDIPFGLLVARLPLQLLLLALIAWVSMRPTRNG
jgi:uncharacterized membrane protein